jgi:hypothetical protein
MLPKLLSQGSEEDVLKDLSNDEGVRGVHFIC